MSQLKRIKSVLEFHEKDVEQGVERTYLYFTRGSEHCHTVKHSADILMSNVWSKMLFIDGSLRCTARDEIIHSKAIVCPLLDALSEKTNILVVGGITGLNASEALGFPGVSSVTMVEADAELLDFIKRFWELNLTHSFRHSRLKLVHEEALPFLRSAAHYNGIIIDLTDASVNTEVLSTLIGLALNSVKHVRGGLVINAGLYLPWNTKKIKQLKDAVEKLCVITPGYKYYVYTTIIPSFNGERAYIAMAHSSRFMKDPEFLELIPAWIRRGTRNLSNRLIDVNAQTFSPF